MTDQSFGIIPIHETDGGRRFLVVHQKKGHWGFPKGHADPGESPTQTALRELAEETGITDCEVLGDGLFIERYAFIDRKGRRVDKTVTFFLGRVGDPSVEVQPDEVQDHAWLPADRVRDRLTFPEARELFSRVLAHLEQTPTD
jgi:8-oxo-dGTP pyrophosphatase MutT (NUDIX family)